MTKNEIYHNLCLIIEDELAFSEKEISLETILTKDCGTDYVFSAIFMILCENQFLMELDDENFIQTDEDKIPDYWVDRPLKDLVDYIYEKGKD